MATTTTTQTSTPNGTSEPATAGTPSQNGTDGAHGATPSQTNAPPQAQSPSQAEPGSDKAEDAPSAAPKDTEPEGGYPKQLHSGKVGLGPNYKQQNSAVGLVYSFRQAV